jgi:hypothetical protein
MLGFSYGNLIQSYSPDGCSWHPEASPEATAVAAVAFAGRVSCLEPRLGAWASIRRLLRYRGQAEFDRRVERKTDPSVAFGNAPPVHSRDEVSGWLS